jgi:(E)-4-hydroxy-3-methyl-but-2-enyl pyrophosphate reductase
MKIHVVKSAGHCFGVKAAIRLAFETAKAAQSPVYTLGPIIHNPQVVEQLKHKGVKAVKNLSEIEQGVIIIRSHGVSPDVIEKAKKKGLTVVDATCPFVRRAQSQAQELVAEGYDLIILGEASHPEVVGIVGTVKGAARVVATAEEIEALPRKNRYGLIAQTTQSLENLQQVASRLLSRTSNLKVLNTICNATTELQRQTRELAQEVELMIVVGGRNSANTARLAQNSRESGVRTQQIETVEEIRAPWLKHINRIGVTAGTSTPAGVVEDIVQKLKSLGTNLKSSSRT